MDLGCNSYSFRSCRRATAFAHMRTLGFHSAELWAGHVHGAEADPEAILAEAREAGIALRAFCIGGLFGLPTEHVRDRLHKAFAFARRLGLDLVSGLVDRAALPIAEEACAAHGVRFAIENHWYTEFARPADYAAIDGCSPAIGVNVDTGHFAFLGCDLAAVARTLGPRTFNVHLKTVTVPGRLGRWHKRMRRDHHMAAALPGPRDGLDGFVAALRDTGYDGMLAIEHEAPELRLSELAQFHARGTELLRATRRMEAA